MWITVFIRDVASYATTRATEDTDKINLERCLRQNTTQPLK